MNLRAMAVAIANQFEGRCTCPAMDGGVECPWCRVFREMLRVHPLDAAPGPSGPARAGSLSPA
jgi:hypothetical protein